MTGPGSVGKTALLKHVEFRSFEERTFLTFFNYSHSSEPLMRFLTSSFSKLLAESFEWARPGDVNEAGNLLMMHALARADFSKLGKELVIIVENAVGLEHFPNILEFARLARHVRFIWVLRDSLAAARLESRTDARVLHVRGLSAEVTAKILRDSFGDQLDNELIEYLVRELEHRHVPLDRLVAAIKNLNREGATLEETTFLALEEFRANIQ